jgi:hypothetical protein
VRCIVCRVPKTVETRPWCLPYSARQKFLTVLGPSVEKFITVHCISVHSPEDCRDKPMVSSIFSFSDISNSVWSFCREVSNSAL